MRQLSSNEKAIIKRFADWDKLTRNQPENDLMINLKVLLNDVLKKYRGRLTINTSSLMVDEIVFESDDPINNLQAHTQMTKDVLETVNFIHYLHSQYLIYLVIKDQTLILRQNGKAIVGDIPNPINIMESYIEDNSLGEKIKSYFGKDIYPTQALLEYFRNNYKSDDDIRHEQNMKAADSSLLEARKSLRIANLSICNTPVVFYALSLPKLRQSS